MRFYPQAHPSPAVAMPEEIAFMTQNNFAQFKKQQEKKTFSDKFYKMLDTTHQQPIVVQGRRKKGKRDWDILKLARDKNKAFTPVRNQPSKSQTQQIAI